MIFRAWVDKNKIKIQTDDSSVKYLLESRQEETKFIPWQKKWGTLTTIHKIYDEKRIAKDSLGLYTFTLGLGWAGYIINVFKKFLSGNDYTDIIQHAIMADNVRTIPFPELRDYQNEDILHILKYRVGLVCVNTSYGELKLPIYAVMYIIKLSKLTVKTEMLISC